MKSRTDCKNLSTLRACYACPRSLAHSRAMGTPPHCLCVRKDSSSSCLRHCPLDLQPGAAVNGRPFVGSEHRSSPSPPQRSACSFWHTNMACTAAPYSLRREQCLASPTERVRFAAAIVRLQASATAVSVKDTLSSDLPRDSLLIDVVDASGSTIPLLADWGEAYA